MQVEKELVKALDRVSALEHPFSRSLGVLAIIVNRYTSILTPAMWQPPRRMLIEIIEDILEGRRVDFRDVPMVRCVSLRLDERNLLNFQSRNDALFSRLASDISFFPTYDLRVPRLRNHIP